MLMVSDIPVFQGVRARDTTCNERGAAIPKPSRGEYSLVATIRFPPSSKISISVFRALALPCREINKSEIGCLFTKHFLRACFNEFMAKSHAELSGGVE
jgi:hypothetical protein